MPSAWNHPVETDNRRNVAGGTQARTRRGVGRVSVRRTTVASCRRGSRGWSSGPWPPPVSSSSSPAWPPTACWRPSAPGGEKTGDVRERRGPGGVGWVADAGAVLPVRLPLRAVRGRRRLPVPWATVVKEFGWATVAEMGVFRGVLAVGLLHAWRRGALRWCDVSTATPVGPRPSASPSACRRSAPGRPSPRTPSSSCSTGAAATASGCSTSAWPAARSSSSRPAWAGTTSSGSA